MAVDAALIELLVCPACHGRIEYKDRRHLIICTSCNRHYPVRDDIPVMLVEEAPIPAPRRSKPAAGESGS